MQKNEREPDATTPPSRTVKEHRSVPVKNPAAEQTERYGCITLHDWIDGMCARCGAVKTKRSGEPA
jgi:hypothetical protein